MLDEQQAQVVKSKILGTWSGSQHIIGDGANAIEKNVFEKVGKADVRFHHYFGKKNRFITFTEIKKSYTKH